MFWFWLSMLSSSRSGPGPQQYCNNTPEHLCHRSNGHQVGTHAVYLSLQWSKWAGEKNLRKNQVFWPTFVFWSISSDTLLPWSTWSTLVPQVQWSPGAQAAYLSLQWSKWAEEKSKKKPSVLTNFCFLVNFIRHTDKEHPSPPYYIQWQVWHWN